MALFSGRKCLIVLGMHRSGTSALTGALQLAGFDLGRHIMPPADENPKGFFENNSIVALNDQILADLYNSWSDTLFIPEDWWRTEKFAVYHQKISEILDEEFTGDRPLLIKDPRLCISLPLFLDVLIKKEVDPAFLVCVRDPLDVAGSLARRNNLSREKAVLLWMDHQLKAELYTRGHSRLFVSYSRFLKDPFKTLQAVKDGLIPEMNLPESLKEEISTFIEPGLTHQGQIDRLPAASYLPGLHELYSLQQDADLLDFTQDELERSNHIRWNFHGMARFFNGLPENYEAALTVIYDNNKKTVLIEKAGYGYNEIIFNLDAEKKVKEMILRPCNSRVALRLAGADGLLPDQGWICFEGITYNAGTKNKETMTMVFDTDLPKIIFNLDEPLALKQVSFKIDYLAFGIASNRKNIWKKQ